MAYYDGWALYGNQTGVSFDLAIKLRTMEGLLKEEIAAQKSLEHDREVSRAATEQESAGKPTDEPDEPPTYSEVTDELMSPWCPNATFPGLNGQVEDPIGGSNSCF